MNNLDFSLVTLQEPADPLTIPPPPTSEPEPWKLWLSWAVFKFPTDSDKQDAE